MRKSFIVLLTLLSVMSVKVKADEGMWLLPLIDRLNVGTMTEMGLKLSAEDIYSINKACLKDAVVIFGGG
ncbi:MAG TPA: S46 family peptidase, partial [Bacteroidales bacterium]|nr:S46 family peptidase [Bacteroidales bacterium]